MSENAGGAVTTDLDATDRIRRFRIAGDVVNQATADLPDEQRSLVRWFHGYCTEHDLPLSEASKLVRRDDSTLHRVFNGKYEGSMLNVCRDIAEFKRIAEERGKGRKLDFIATALSKRIAKLCDAAREYQRIGFIFGDTQTGKTTALEAYTAANNHGSTIYVRMPTGGSVGGFARALAKALRISPRLEMFELMERVKSAIDDRMLLIIDEAHQVLMGRREKNVRAIELIREIHDVTRCGVIVCGTNVFRDELENGRCAGMLLQCKRRRLAALQLPNAPTRDDLATFAAAYDLPPATGEAAELQNRVIHDEALGMWLTLLRMGAKLAAKAGESMAWKHVIRAHDGLRTLEGGRL